MFVMWNDFDLIAYVFFSFFLYYYMFSELTPSLFVFAGLALRLRNRSYIGYESWSQVHAFRELGKSTALIVTREKGYAYLFNFVQENHCLWCKMKYFQKKKIRCYYYYNF